MESRLSGSVSINGARASSHLELRRNTMVGQHVACITLICQPLATAIWRRAADTYGRKFKDGNIPIEATEVDPVASS